MEVDIERGEGEEDSSGKDDGDDGDCSCREWWCRWVIEVDMEEEEEGKETTEIEVVVMVVVLEIVMVRDIDVVDG